MNAKILDKTGKEKGTITLPSNFNTRIRNDILSKVFEAQKLSFTQPYGAMEGAGAQYSASGILKHARHVWKTTYGKGISRVPRKIMSRNGSSFNWVGATVSNARGGRKPHAPRSEKNLYKKINKKELLIAFNSAFAGSISSSELSKKYNMEIPTGFIFHSDILTIKSKEFFTILQKLFGNGFDKALKTKKVRAGRGKTRGRKYKSNAGMLFVIASDEEMSRNRIDIVKVSDLKIKDLAPNGEAGRITCYTEKAIKEIGERFK